MGTITQSKLVQAIDYELLKKDIDYLLSSVKNRVESLTKYPTIDSFKDKQKEFLEKAKK